MPEDEPRRQDGLGRWAVLVLGEGEVEGLARESRRVWAMVVSATVDQAGYTGVVGLEAFASGDSDTALQRFRQAFTA